MCTGERDSTATGSAGQVEPVKVDIGMWHPHYQDLKRPFVGVKSGDGIFEAIERDFARPQDEVMFQQSSCRWSVTFQGAS